jgi:antiviral helicase SKI2
MMQQINVDAIVDKRLKTSMQHAATQLNDLASRWSGLQAIPEVDWSRIRTLEFQEVLQNRDQIVRVLDGYGCLHCETFDEHVCPGSYSILIDLMGAVRACQCRDGSTSKH